MSKTAELAPKTGTAGTAAAAAAAAVAVIGASVSGSVMVVNCDVLIMAELSNSELASGDIDLRTAAVIVVAGCKASGSSCRAGACRGQFPSICRILKRAARQRDRGQRSGEAGSGQNTHLIRVL